MQFTLDARKRARKGDVLFCVRGSTTGRMNWADREYAIGRGVAAIRHRTRPELQPLVRAVIEYGLPGLLAQATGSTFPNVSADQLAGLWWPPLDDDEQRAIAHILGTLDDKIELNRRMNETLEAMARALFKSWLVDFDPVRAKAEGRDPGLPESLADLFPDSFEDSELGEIPRGWKMVPLPEVIDVNPARSLRKGIEAPYLDMANMPTHGHSPDEVVVRAFGSGMRFSNGDTLVARITPCLENGKTAFVDFLETGQVGWGSTEYIVLRPKPPIPEEFAYCLARSAEFRDFAIQSMTGSSGRQRVPAESLAHFRVVAAPKPIADLFGRLIKPLFAHASAATKEGRTLAALRNTLLPKLISGELRVKDAEHQVEEVA
jgi:type I restriction enzyme S subunit